MANVYDTFGGDFQELDRKLKEHLRVPVVRPRATPFLDQFKQARPKVPEPLPDERPNRLREVRVRMSQTDPRSPEYQSLAAEADALERLEAAVPSLGKQVGRVMGMLEQLSLETPAMITGKAVPEYKATKMPATPPLPLPLRVPGTVGVGEMLGRATGLDIPGVTRFPKQTLGVKGALEMVADPTNLAPGGLLYSPARGVAKAGARAVGREAVRVATPGPGGILPGSRGMARVPKKAPGTKPPSPINPADIAADMKAKGIGRTESWSRWIQRTGLNPGMDAKDWFRIYDSVSPAVGRQPIKIPIGEKGLLGSTPVSPSQVIRNLESADFGKLVEVRTQVGKGQYEWRPATIEQTLNDGRLYEVRVANPARPGMEGGTTTLRVPANDVRKPLIAKPPSPIAAEAKAGTIRPPVQATEAAPPVAQAPNAPTPRGTIGAGSGVPPVEPPKPPTAGAPTPPSGPDPLQAFGRWLAAPDRAEEWQNIKNLRAAEFGRRIQAMVPRAQELVEQGSGPEEAMKQAVSETLSGAYPAGRTTLEGITGDIRQAMFQRVKDVLITEDPKALPSTIDALTNVLMGKPVPSTPGIAGGSAMTRLLRVFGDSPEMIQVIEKAAKSKKSLDSIVNDAMLAGKQSPIARDEANEAYLMSLSTQGEQLPIRPREPMEQLPPDLRTATQKQLELLDFKRELRGETPPGEMPIYPEGTALQRSTGEQLSSDVLLPPQGTVGSIPDLRSPLEREMQKQQTQLGASLQGRPAQVSLFDPPVQAAFDDAAKQGIMVPAEQRHIMMRVLKEAGLTGIDIGNAVRAILSSVDFSWWRQQMKFIPRAAFDSRYRQAFLQGNAKAWGAMKHQQVADASWKAIQNDPLFPLYEKLADEGYDFLRPLDTAKRIAGGVEEYGYLGADRPIGRFVGKLPSVKISQRSFVTGTNEMNWRLFKSYYDQLLDIRNQMAAGKIKLPEGQVLNMEKELRDYANLLSNFTGRANLGRARPLAKGLSAAFFAPRLALGVLLSPMQMASRNPRIRAEAMKNMLSYVTGIGGVVLAGYELGLWDTSLDPANADFGKIRIGNMHIDPWGGTQQYAVLAARLATRRYASSETGLSRPIGFEESVAHFGRGKLAPAPAFGVDVASGKTFSGEKVDLTSPGQWARRVASINPMSVIEAGKREGPVAAAIAAPLSTVGLGVNTYGKVPAAWRADFAKYATIPANDKQAKIEKKTTRELYRKAHPDVDAKLYIAGEVESLETGVARSIVLRLIRENKVNPKEVPGLQPKEFESDERKALRLWILRALGQSVVPQNQAPVTPGYIVPPIGTDAWRAIQRQQAAGAR